MADSFCLSRGEQNILEAASNGASASVGLVANIAANLIAFLAVLEFVNAALSWLGEMVDIKGLSFQVVHYQPPHKIPSPSLPPSLQPFSSPPTLSPP